MEKAYHLVDARQVTLSAEQSRGNRLRTTAGAQGYMMGKQSHRFVDIRLEIA